jgi:hypothetical protein
MSNEVHTSTEEHSTTALVRGIISDLGDLIRQEMLFARTEIKSDLRKTKEAATVLALGVGTAVLGIFLLAVMLVFLLHWLCLPAEAVNSFDPGNIPCGVALESCRPYSWEPALFSSGWDTRSSRASIHCLMRRPRP